MRHITLLITSAVCTALALWPPYGIPNLMCAFSGGACITCFVWMKSYNDLLTANRNIGIVLDFVMRDMTKLEKTHTITMARDWSERRMKNDRG